MFKRFLTTRCWLYLFHALEIKFHEILLKAGVLINTPNFNGKQLRWNFFLIKLKALSAL